MTDECLWCGDPIYDDDSPFCSAECEESYEEMECA
jgi:predicted nucleic acid-binding Zn ribbon protein